MRPARKPRLFYGRFGWCTAAIIAAVCVIAHSTEAQTLCSPRGITEPGRLNISVNTEDFGLVPPCRATLLIYIAQNTELGRIDGSLRAFSQSSVDERTLPFSVRLERLTGGLYRAQLPLPIINTACITTAVEMEIFQCSEAGGKSISCPNIRLLGSDTFGHVTLRGAGLDICLDL